MQELRTDPSASQDRRKQQRNLSDRDLALLSLQNREMSKRCVSDFVPNNSSQLIVAFRELEQALINVNVSARKRKGIDVVTLNDLERVRERIEPLITPRDRE